MRKTLRSISAMLLAALLLLCSPAALAAIDFGVTVTPSTLSDGSETLKVTTADTAFDSLEPGTSLAFSTPCNFPKAYVVFERSLIDSTLEAAAVQFPVAKSGTYLVVNGTLPTVTSANGQITVAVSKQHTLVLDSYTIACDLKDPQVKLNGEAVESVAKDGQLTITLKGEGSYIVTGTQPPAVTGIKITAKADTVEAGKTLQFTAEVTGDPTAPVTWTVSGAVSTKTVIDAKGLLTLGPDETAKTLTVTATAGGKSATLTVTVTQPAPPVYKLTKGDKSKWTRGSGKTLVFASDADIDLLSAVEVDEKPLKATDYEIKDGEIRLKPAYLATLSTGKHAIVLRYKDGGTAQGTFSIHISISNAFTGDQFPLTMLTIIMVLSLTGLIVVLWKRKK